MRNRYKIGDRVRVIAVEAPVVRTGEVLASYGDEGVRVRHDNHPPDHPGLNWTLDEIEPFSPGIVVGRLFSGSYHRRRRYAFGFKPAKDTILWHFAANGLQSSVSVKILFIKAYREGYNQAFFTKLGLKETNTLAEAMIENIGELYLFDYEMKAIRDQPSVLKGLQDGKICIRPMTLDRDSPETEQQLMSRIRNGIELWRPQ